ncbi:hypothetical protein FBQ82_00120 [Anaerolineae bacterium CFX7]|nr:hypothetical protein [Anaerolineae bacterium CFX7]
MNAKGRYFLFVPLAAALLFVAAFPASTNANHSWGNYHWARTSNPFTINIIDSMSTDWDDNLNAAISDWNASSVMNVTKEAGASDTSTRRLCRPVKGKVRSCNYTYGTNGWLGLAQIWAKGSHITQGTAKMNDSYLSSGYTETNRQHVICQEIGHDWGLDHQDESGADLNTCMDYDDNLSNPDPNQHDYQQLETIYAHLDSSSTIGAAPEAFINADLSERAQWGRLVRTSGNGRTSLFVRNFGGGNKVFTFVYWAK